MLDDFEVNFPHCFEFYGSITCSHLPNAKILYTTIFKGKYRTSTSDIQQNFLWICFCIVNYAVYPIEQFQSSVGIFIYLASETSKFYQIDLWIEHFLPQMFTYLQVMVVQKNQTMTGKQTKMVMELTLELLYYLPR